MKLFLAWAFLLTLAPVPGSASPPGARQFRITGVAVSARDGAPIPYCRISASPTQAAVAGTSLQMGRTPAMMQDSGPGMQRPGFGGRADSSVHAVADVSGRFTLDLPRGGLWRVGGEARGFASQSYEQHEGFFAGVALTETSPAYTLRLRLEPDAMFSGLVLDQAGEAVESAQVVAERVEPEDPSTPGRARNRQAGSSQTDDRGHFEINGLRPGIYRLRVQATPWYSSSSRGRVLQVAVRGASASTAPEPPDPLDLVYPVTWFPGTDDDQAAEPIVLRGGEVRQADFHLTPLPASHLHLPNPNPPVAMGAADARGPRPLRTAMPTLVRTSLNAGGMGGMPTIFNGKDIDFGGLAPGTYELRTPSADGQSPDEVREIVVRPGAGAEISLEGATSLIPVTIETDVDGGRNAPLVELVSRASGRRFAAVPSQAGRGQNRGGADASPGGGLRSAGVAGRTRVALVEAGRYDVVAGAGGGTQYLTAITADGAKVQGRAVTIDRPASLTLHFASEHGEIDGVANVAGKSAVAAMVLLVPATLGQAGSMSEVVRDETNTDGSFTLRNVIPGAYILVVILRGWDVDWRRPETMATYLLRGKPIQVEAGGSLHLEVDAVSP